MNKLAIILSAHASCPSGFDACTSTGMLLTVRGLVITDRVLIRYVDSRNTSPITGLMKRKIINGSRRPVQKKTKLIGLMASRVCWCAISRSDVRGFGAGLQYVWWHPETGSRIVIVRCVNMLTTPVLRSLPLVHSKNSLSLSFSLSLSLSRVYPFLCGGGSCVPMYARTLNYTS